MNATVPAAADAAPCKAVVVPCFQRQAGLLGACVYSVQQQQGVPPCDVIVVDDSSTHPAAVELADLLPQCRQVRVVVQTKAGPGAARNRGLTAAQPATRFVAFLDSDDEWMPDFATTAQAAFSGGG